ncbi:hypothetical protein OG762_34635 [Streptomyces sp. NBC_01136]|nr:hypothetical protein OG762_34635 [Streptomyces sp. NBC_01136]
MRSAFLARHRSPVRALEHIDGYLPGCHRPAATAAGGVDTIAEPPTG